MPTTCPAAIVDIDRDVPGKIAERICAAPIQAAWGKVISSICVTRGRVKRASTPHMMTPPMRSANAITQRFSRFLPICFVKAHAGTAVTTNAISVRLNGSEEHTSELQSRRDLVCRLLLEKKKKKHTSEHQSHRYHVCILTPDKTQL